jgi:uncharacterized membrane protein
VDVKVCLKELHELVLNKVNWKNLFTTLGYSFSRFSYTIAISRMTSRWMHETRTKYQQCLESSGLANVQTNTSYLPSREVPNPSYSKR